ncbi:hypothetical protein N431DRAFT_456973 [Stipitochalara longipes BDJ]|nr:hypothetical protein N431DRAFT_456973 [Stipitochalara longipes BDJ]
MPIELLDAICTFLPQQGLHSLMLCNSNFSEVAAQYLYMEPEFASTYRFAQFTFIVVNRQHYAQMVRSLDISKFDSIRDRGGEPAEMAGWREFKYRHEQMFTVRPQSSSFASSSSSPPYKPLKKPNVPPSSTHPFPSPLLSSFHRVRDVPIGGIYHVLGACARIKRLNMSRLHLASDFMVKNPTNPRSTLAYSLSLNVDVFRPEHSKEIVTFVSDVPNSWTWQHSELVAIYADALLDLMFRLRELETFKAQDTIWLNTAMVKRLMKETPRAETGVRGLRQVDFTNSGMEPGLPWAIKGSREKVESIVGEMGDASGKRMVSRVVGGNLGFDFAKEQLRSPTFKTM